MHLTKNYNTDGGDRTVIGGTLEFEQGAEVKNFPGGGSQSGKAENQSASSATAVTGLKNDFNALLVKLKDGNGNYIWKPGLDTAKPDTILGRPIRTSTFMPTMSAGERVLLFGDLKNYWVADRQNRTFRRLNELYARTDQVGFLTTQRVDGRLILPESVKVLKMAGNKTAASTPDPEEEPNG